MELGHKASFIQLSEAYGLVRLLSPTSSLSNFQSALTGITGITTEGTGFSCTWTPATRWWQLQKLLLTSGHL